jgi:hypothetical protein
MKIRPVGAEIFGRTDRRTDMMEQIVAFHSVTKVPKNCMRGDELDLSDSAHGSVKLLRKVKIFPLTFGCPKSVTVTCRLTSKQQTMFYTPHSQSRSR